MSKKNNDQIKKAVDFDEYLALRIKNKKFRNDFENYGKQLEISYKVLQLHKQEGVSQKELAEKIGTHQSNVARIESGQQNLTTALLQKIALAFGRKLVIDFAM
ncbi:transcriptional regulator [bacterium (Candidatus Gribaldobacteria) CG23_combo_of_CG06-09_8_20_14_all_37_87_8]|uniref:Transcriptional regulator n=1 Tax=bacterium (Candidatus Gribaldobacteria) CG23_combo_of_CG06-09_8_20_14_all_37_87_8 TaxID=2014278 RepID=A0A2G9ZEU9_9BACT|nr:MAG: transcriptional regulator [bacterium (Candidatus Gribaldobacteria) CG23_combo_of_CG06-09_8_20_14_all_37_87_8]